MSTRTIAPDSMLGALLALLPGNSTVDLEHNEEKGVWQVTVGIDFEQVNGTVVASDPKLLLAIVTAERLVDEILDVTAAGQRPGLFSDKPEGGPESY